MNEYLVSYMAIYYDTVKADTPEEAAEIVAKECPFDVDGYAHVTDIMTDEEWDI